MSTRVRNFRSRAQHAVFTFKAASHAGKSTIACGRTLAQLPLAELQPFDTRVGKDVFPLLELRSSLAARQGLGSTPPASE